MWTGPVEVTIDELFVIAGPNIDTYMSQDDSYIQDDLGAPYDPKNMFNIFENQLKLKPRP